MLHNLPHIESHPWPLKFFHTYFSYLEAFSTPVAFLATFLVYDTPL